MKKALITLITTTLIGMLLLVALVATIDPFFHYHKPINNKSRFYNEIYQDPGIALNYTYDTVILGSSMTENFHIKDLAVYGEDAVKISYSGATTKDISNILGLIFSSNHNIKRIYIDLNDYQLCSFPDVNFTDIPSYLYDRNYITDVQYIFNKDVIYECLHQIISKEEYDIDYAFTWEEDDLFGADKVIEDFNSSHIDQAWIADNSIESKEALSRVKDNMNNILSIVAMHPETEFVFFYPPYSEAYWYDINRQNVLNDKITMLDLSMEELFKYDNVVVYMFMDDYDVISNLDNYRDICHFKPTINKQLLDYMHTENYKITKDNYLERLNTLKDYALNIDLFKD